MDTIIKFFTDTLAGALKTDYMLGALGLVAVIFVLMLVFGGYPSKFKKKSQEVVTYLKANTGTEKLDVMMDEYPKAVNGAWKNYRSSSNAAPAVYLTQNVCVDAPSAGKARSPRNFFFGVIIIAAVAFFLNLLILNGAPVTANEAFAPLAALLLGAIFTVVLGIIAKKRYNGALAAYNDLIACLNIYMPQQGSVLALPVGATVHSETYESTLPVFGEAAEKPFEPAAAGTAPETQEPFTPPVFTPPAFTPTPAASDLGGSDGFYADPRKEDVVAQIERITTSGASKQTMLEVAKLLQAERAKAENKTPEQQRRLNAALATLLKAISSANK